jgi:hypothetical protein
VAAMIEPAQLRRLCQWNRELVRENSRLRDEQRRKDRQIGELEEANAEIAVERDAADALLGTALDQMASRERQP